MKCASFRILMKDTFQLDSDIADAFQKKQMDKAVSYTHLRAHETG